MPTATKPVTICIDTHVHFSILSIPWEVEAQIKAAMTVDNPVYRDAERAGISTRGIPPRLAMWAPRDDTLVLPRGALRSLCGGFDALGIPWTLDDHRKFATRRQNGVWGHPPSLRSYQEVAVTEMLAAEQGVYEASPGSGKTVTALGMIHRSQSARALVIVNTTNIVEQWRERARQHLGVEAGIVGDGHFDIQPLTIATQQTLWSRRDDLSEAVWPRSGLLLNFWELWSFVLLDECHIVPADTYLDIIQRFPARYRFGLSATPEKREGTLPIVEAVIGPVTHVTPKQALRDEGVVCTPLVTVVTTGFDFDLGDRDTGYQRRNAYAKMLGVLAKDEDRNRLIGSLVVADWARGATCLVVSRRIGHLRALRTEILRLAGVAPDDVILFTGEQATTERMAIQERASQGGVVLLSTIADEALDIPRLDRLFLTWPTRNKSIVRQQVGRIERVHPGKERAIVYDFWDRKIQPLNAQYRERRIGVYDYERYPVVILDAS